MFSLLLKGLTPPCNDIISSQRSSFRASPGVFVFQFSLTVNSEYGIFTDFNGDLYRIMYIYSFFRFLCLFSSCIFCLVCLSFFDYLLLSDVGGRS